MALVPCRACGNPCDTAARACPKCGRPNPTMTLRGVLVGLGLLIVLGAGVALCTSSETKPRLSAPTLGAAAAVPRAAVPPVARLVSEVPELERKMMADPSYGRVWSRPQDLETMLTALSQLEQYQTVQEGGTGRVQNDIHARAVAAGVWDIAKTAFLIDARTGHFPEDFARRVGAYMDSVSEKPHMGVWRGKPHPMDFSVVAALVRDDAGYLRQVCDAPPDGWPELDAEPFRPWLSRERDCLLRLDRLGGLTKSERLRLAELEQRTQFGDLEIVDAAFRRGEYATQVVGTIVNHGSRTYAYAQVTFRLYDEDGNQVGSTLANINNLDGNGSWKFAAPVLNSAATRALIGDVTTF